MHFFQKFRDLHVQQEIYHDFCSQSESDLMPLVCGFQGAQKISFRKMNCREA